MRGGIEHQVLIGAAVVYTDDDPRGIGLCQIGSCFVEFEHVLSVNGGGAAQSGEVFAGFGRQGAVTTLVRDDIGTLSIEIGQRGHGTVLEHAGVVRQVAKGFFEFSPGCGGQMVAHAAEIFLHIGRGIVIELAGVGKMFLDQGAQSGGILHLEVDFRKRHKVFSPLGETFGEIQAEELTGGQRQGAVEGQDLRGGLRQSVSSDRRPRTARARGGLHLHGAGEILVGIAVTGVGGQSDAFNSSFAVVREGDVVRVVGLRSAHPFGVPEAAVVAVEDEFRQTILTVVLAARLL